MKAPKEPAALKRALKRLELTKHYRDIDVARRDHLLREQRANLMHERQRLQSVGEMILPGLREHMTRRNTALAAMPRRQRQ